MIISCSESIDFGHSDRADGFDHERGYVPQERIHYPRRLRHPVHVLVEEHFDRDWLPDSHVHYHATLGASHAIHSEAVLGDQG